MWPGYLDDTEGYILPRLVGQPCPSVSPASLELLPRVHLTYIKRIVCENIRNSQLLPERSKSNRFKLNSNHPFKAALDAFDFAKYVKNVASVYNLKADRARWGYECIRLPFLILPMIALLLCLGTVAAGTYEIVNICERRMNCVFPWVLIVISCVIVGSFVVGFFSLLCCAAERPVLMLSKFQLRICKSYLEVCHKPHVFIRKLRPEMEPGLRNAINIHLAGSAADGYGFFPALAADIGLDCIQIFRQDIDINLVYTKYTVYPIQLIPTGVPGYVWVNIPKDDTRFEKDDLIYNCSKLYGTLTYISAKRTLMCLAANLPLKPHVQAGHPTVKFAVPLKCQRGNYDLDIDMAFALPLKPWPTEAQEWIYRPRSGVTHGLIDEIVQDGALLVAKGCPKRGCQHDLDWRITFTQAEVKLFHHHADDKKSLKLCYIILKFIIKTVHLDNRKLDIEEGVHLPALKSYYLKTLYLWIAENPPEFCVRNPDMNRIFVFLIKKFHDALRAGRLPNYFLPQINLIADLDRHSIRKGITCLRMIRQKRNVFIHRFQMLWFDKFSRDRWRGALGEKDRNNFCQYLMRILTLG